MSIIPFTKMQGLGNDFIVIDAFSQTIQLSNSQIKKLANRHFGIGADQVLLIEKSISQDANFRYRIFNADGIEVEHCGNGARCFAKYVRENGLINHDTIRVEVNDTISIMTYNRDGNITIEMSVPDFTSQSLPFIPGNLNHRLEKNCIIWNIDHISTQATQHTNHQNHAIKTTNSIEFSIVSMGNPHAVIITNNLDTMTINTIAKFLEQSGHFPRGINVGFVEIINNHTIKLRVHERGVGETLACGTGACAAAVLGIRRNLLTSPVQVQMPGGMLSISWNSIDPAAPVIMTGPAKIVFHGQIDLASL